MKYEEAKQEREACIHNFVCLSVNLIWMIKNYTISFSIHVQYIEIRVSSLINLPFVYLWKASPPISFCLPCFNARLLFPFLVLLSNFALIHEYWPLVSFYILSYFKNFDIGIY